MLDELKDLVEKGLFTEVRPWAASLFHQIAHHLSLLISYPLGSLNTHAYAHNIRSSRSISVIRDLMNHWTIHLLQKETKQILKKRTAYESALIRRVAKKADYLRYAAYEMGLEQLRRKRVERMSELSRF